MNPIYFVEVNFGKAGKSFIETDRDRNSHKQVIADILSGEIEKPIRVLEVIEDEKSCRDVTEDIAREVRDLIVASGVQPTYQQVNFIHEQLGVNAIRWDFEPSNLQAAE